MESVPKLKDKTRVTSGRPMRISQMRAGSCSTDWLRKRERLTPSG